MEIDELGAWLETRATLGACTLCTRHTPQASAIKEQTALPAMAPQFSFITVFHRIYCHLRNIMSDLPPSPEKSWLDGFQTTPNTYLPFNIDRLTDDYIHRGWLASDLQISLLEFFKHRKGIKHEFLITTLTNSATGKMAGYILAERQGVRPAHAENDPASSTHSFSSISKSSSVSSTAAKVLSTSSTELPASNVFYLGQDQKIMLTCAKHTVKSVVVRHNPVSQKNSTDSMLLVIRVIRIILDFNTCDELIHHAGKPVLSS
ncbi:hypothetical protein SCP_0803260 [Sparassis crispa]|uniref:Uncharacterized protein n=1 Tax=Sparassis crispa TaxID=139825 RepID=A0A401GVL3_9APHY|nr:hypothetical protein SCP_0803260 [Sparassis crispa]GBE85804.1 hypothetical protein SCP_0803260 [Sparassis crispa]